MIRLLVFAPCERVILGDDKLVSMIALLEAVNLAISGDLPANAVYPMPWGVLSMWTRTEDAQEAVTYEQRVDIIRPDGERVGGSSVEFIVNNESTNYRNISKFTNFPVGVDGVCKLKLSLRLAGEGNEWREIAEYPIVMKLIHKEAEGEKPAAGPAEETAKVE